MHRHAIRSTPMTLRWRNACATTLLLGATLARAQIFNDGFEGLSLDPFWTVAANLHYDVSLTTSPTHTGSQALAFTSLPGSGENGRVALEHFWSGPQQGSASIWLYDHAPLSADSYIGLEIVDTVSGVEHGISIRDSSASFYYDHLGVTSVPRTLGWHELKLVVDSSGTSAYLDGAFLSTVASMTSFDEIQLFGAQANFRQNSTYSVDDFSVSAIPEPSATASAIGLVAFCILWSGMKRVLCRPKV